LIKEIVGPDINVIDPAPAVARQTARILSEWNNSVDDFNDNRIFLITSGQKQKFEKFISLIAIENSEIFQANWSRDKREINIVQNKNDHP
jgi:glutamate racemase